MGHPSLLRDCHETAAGVSAGGGSGPDRRAGCGLLVLAGALDEDQRSAARPAGAHGDAGSVERS